MVHSVHGAGSLVHARVSVVHTGHVAHVVASRFLPGSRLLRPLSARPTVVHILHVSPFSASGAAARGQRQGCGQQKTHYRVLAHLRSFLPMLHGDPYRV